MRHVLAYTVAWQSALTQIKHVNRVRPEYRQFPKVSTRPDRLNDVILVYLTAEKQLINCPTTSLQLTGELVGPWRDVIFVLTLPVA